MPLQLFFCISLLGVFPPSFAKHLIIENDIENNQLESLPEKTEFNIFNIYLKNKLNDKNYSKVYIINSTNIAWNPFERLTNPLGRLRKNEYNRCMNKLHYRNLPSPFNVKTDNSSYCSCVVKEVTFFKRLSDVVYNEARHCIKLMENEIWRNIRKY